MTPRTAECLRVPAGHILRIACTEGPQVGDLNLWNAADLSERVFSGKARALHGTHVTAGDRLWSCLPHLRPMATVIHDSLGWYGIDGDGASVHDVIGTRCDPYTRALLAMADAVDVVFLGLGDGIAHPPAALRDALDAAGVGVEAMSSPAAARSYNVILSEGRRIAAALLPVGEAG